MLYLEKATSFSWLTIDYLGSTSTTMEGLSISSEVLSCY